MIQSKWDGLISIDPSIKTCGVAIFDRNKLIYCNVIRPTAVVNMLVGIQDVVRLTQEAWEKTMGSSFSPETLVIEKPQVYQQAQLKGDPNDLIPLAILAGMFWERFKPKNILMPLPKDWKGQVPKDVMTKKTFAKLERREIEVFKDDLVRVPTYLHHNGFDAVGLGLWGLKRLGIRE